MQVWGGVRISDNFTDVINVKLLRPAAARALLPLIPFLGLPPFSSSLYRAAGETTPQAAIISRARAINVAICMSGSVIYHVHRTCKLA